jgi:hypothetical protein
MPTSNVQPKVRLFNDADDPMKTEFIVSVKVEGALSGALSSAGFAGPS